ncbi:LuxR C-terminal-related transcriptional regulator [Streptomyces sp. NRRL S-920]|uniref:LuxR C-terminal-related transcriptional regulator n=1 Tax=Streptomyces sp. NRRL S-920 TaxID=1463921 RepID=UPI0004C48B18|nr:LuxR C-terminal-related transcriptional regulator [Streptomyces sp. NRRL S-920]
MSADTVTTSFTRRERQVVQGLAEGLTDHEIARRLNRKTATIRRHITAASKKVGAKGQVGLVNCSYALGLLRPPASEGGAVYVPPQLRELIPLIVQGLSAMKIAEETNRAPSRIHRDTKRLMHILRARTRPHIVTRARQYGLLKAAAPRASATVQT